MSDKVVFINGQFVSERISQVVEAIRDYCPDIIVEWIPKSERKPDQAAFKLTHAEPGRQPYTIMTVKTEEEFDARVLKRLIMGDQRFGNGATLGEIEAAEEAAKRIATQRMLDEQEEMLDKMHFVLSTPKHNVKIDENLSFKDGIPFFQKKRQ